MSCLALVRSSKYLVGVGVVLVPTSCSEGFRQGLLRGLIDREYSKAIRKYGFLESNESLRRLAEDARFEEL